MKNPLRILVAFTLATVLLAACGTTAPPEFTLSVTVAGTGTGTVVSDPVGIDTADDAFEAAFAQDTVVTLTAAATGGSTFAGFTGATCETGSTATTCILTVDAAKDVTATFTAPTATETLEVTVNAGGAAAGSVVSDPAGIDTASDVTEATFDVGTVVTLTATADAEFFAGWTGGPCEGLQTETCVVTIAAGQQPVVANFNEATTLTVQITAESDTAEEFLDASLDDAVRWPEGHTYVFSTDLEIGYDPQHGPQAIGLRFADVTVPVGANVLEAELGFTAFGPTTGSGTDVALTITGEASTASTTFVGDSVGTPGAPGPNPASFGVTSLDRTTANVAWTITEAWTNGEIYVSPDTVSIVREIVGLTGWASGGSLVFVLEPIDDTSTAFRRAYASAVAGNELDAPTLTVRYVALP